MTTTMILILVLSASVFAVIVGLIAWAIATAHHDHHAIMSGTPRHRAHPHVRHERHESHERRSSSEAVRGFVRAARD